MPAEPVSPQHRFEPDASVRVVPTLFIGLGGTGAEVLLRLRRRILAHTWGRPDAPVWLSSLAEFSAAQFLYFDVGNQSSDRPIAETAQLDELVRFTDSESLGRAINLDQYFRDDTILGRYPMIESWFPMPPRQVREWCQEEDRRSSHNQPTRAPRCFSRLLFFHEYWRIRQAFLAKLNCLRAGLTNREALERLGLGIEQNRSRIVIIGSIAGGTGSGAFLDMGYLAEQLGKRIFDRCDVDLSMLLPSCFKGDMQADKEAIAYAALMELETLLSEGPRNFVRKWEAADLDCDIPAYPFDNVFLFDTGNLAGEQADQVDDLFDMVSSVLFDDCKPTDFADLKRRLAAAWRLHNKYKHDSYIAPIGRKYGDLKLRYCGQYLSFGQSSVATELASRRDEIASQHVSVMLRAFFGIADDAGPGCKSPPVPADARALLDTYAHCIAEGFTVGYRFVADATARYQGSRHELPRLVHHLLLDRGKPILDRLGDLIEENIRRIRATSNASERIKLVDQLAEMVESELRLEPLIRERGEQVCNALVAEDSGLTTALWAMVESRDKGGLQYTLQLIELIKGLIESDRSGLLARLDASKAWFEDLSNLLRGPEVGALTERIRQARRGILGSIVGADRQVQRLGEAMRWYAEARVRAIACGEARRVLELLSQHLGEREGHPYTGRTRWAAGGLAARLAASEERILEIIHATDRASTGSRKAMSSQHLTCQVIPASTSELDAARRLEPAAALEWARQHFGADGAQVVLQQLQDSQGRALMLRRLQTFVLQKLPPLGLGDENPLIKALEDMPAPQRRDYFERCLKMAMPWIEADVHDDWFTGPGMYICIVGVNDRDSFERRFGDEVRAAVPAATRLLPDIRFVESDEPGRLTCYVELAGFPLTALSKLRKWRTSYDGNRDTFPLHIHRNSTQFRHPTAPTDQELERLVEDYRIFLEGVMTGVLTPTKGIYGFTSRLGRLDIGSEAFVRKDGVHVRHTEPIKDQTAAVLSTADEESVAAMYALCEYYKFYVYPTAKITVNEETKFIKGLPTFIVESMADGTPAAHIEGYRNRLRNHDPERVLDLLLRPENVNSWSQEIPGSENDYSKADIREYSTEEAMASPFPYYIKRSLREGWATQVRRILSRADEAIKPAKRTPPLDDTGRQVYVAIAGQQSGPYPEATIRKMIQSCQLHPTGTHVWWAGLNMWVLLKDCPDLLAPEAPATPTAPIPQRQ